MEELTQDNREYIDIMARLFDKTPAGLLNNIVDAHRARNAAIYEKAREEGENTGGKISIMNTLGGKC